jgi:hypothetical protein
MKGARIIALLALALSSLAMLVRPVQATPAQQANIRVTMTVDAGFNSYIKDHAWIPLRVTLVNAGDPIDGSVVISDKRFAIAERFIQPVSLGRGARRTLMLYAPALTDAFEVQLLSGATVIAAVTPVVRQLAPGDRLALIASDPPDAFNFIGDVRTANGSTTSIALLRFDQFSDHTAALDAADVIVFSGIDTSQLTQAQRDAINQWVAGGGHLILAGGPNAQLTFSGFGDVLPSRAGLALVNTSAESLGGLAAPASLFQLSPVPTQTIAVSRLQLDVPGSRALAGSPETPLIVRRDLGRGMIDQLAFDPSLAPLRDWDGRAALFAALFNGRASKTNDIGALPDVEGAQYAASALEAASPPSAFVVAGFFALYVLVIGPLNFLLLRRFKRQAWAWLSIPAIVIAFTLLGLLTGFRLRGNNPQVHRLSVTLGDDVAAGARSYSIYGLFSPRRANVDFDVDRALPQMVSEPADPEQTQLSIDIDFGNPTRIRQVPLTNSDVRTVYARDGGPLQTIVTDLAYVPGSANTASALMGNVRNDSPYALSDCVLMAGKDYQAIGDLPANGGSANVKLNLVVNHPQSLIDLRSINATRDRLMSSRSFGAGGGQRSAPASSSSPTVSNTSTEFPFEQNGAPITDAMVNWQEFSDAPVRQDAYYGLIATVFGSESAGAGVFVGCWEARDTTNALIDGADYTDHAARIWRVPVKGHVAGSGESLPPEVFAWNVVTSSSSSELNDDGMLFEPGEHIISLTPWFDLRTNVISATVAMNLDFNVNASSLQGLRDTTIALYNWQTRAYERVIDQADDSASQNAIPGPYVSPSGQVMMKLSVNSESITLSRIAPRVEMTK